MRTSCLCSEKGSGFTGIFLVSEDPITTAINLNNAFYFGIFENYSMNGSFRLKDEERCEYSGWVVNPGAEPEKEVESSQSATHRVRGAASTGELINTTD